MTSRDSGLPRAAQADMILLALFQSRLQERSLYLGEEIRAQRRRLSSRPRMRDPHAHDDSPAAQARIERAEQALAAVQQAQERLGQGSYGLCDECRLPIGWDALFDAPEQTVCAGCSQFSPLDEARPEA